MELINKIDETFKFENKEIRIIGTYEKPWFVAKDICDILELSNVTESLRNIPEKWRSSEILRSTYNSQSMNIISEAAVYKLIMRSNKPIAQKFQEVVCEEILPSIRKKGEYKFQKIIEENKKQLEEKKVELKNKDREIKTLHTLVKKKHRKRYSFSHCVYIIKNPSIKNSFKIGMTENKNKRLEALGPGSSKPYEIAHHRDVCNATEAKAMESLMLGIFDKYRLETDIRCGKLREWVENIDFKIVKKEMDNLVNYYQEKKRFYTNKFNTENADKIKKEEDDREYIIEDEDEEEYEYEDQDDEYEDDEEEYEDEDQDEEYEDDEEDDEDEDEYEDEIEDDKYLIENDTKVCYQCQELKSKSEYYDRPENCDGKEGVCKTCYIHNKKILKNEKDEREIIIREEGTKKCRKCKIVKNFSEFMKHSTSKDGYEYTCLECKKLTMKKVESKQCVTCRVNKTIDNYNTFRLGFNKDCKECEEKNKKDEKFDENIKKCSNCKVTKSIDIFSKCNGSSDGYNNYCSECSKEKSRVYRQKRKEQPKLEIKNKICNSCKIKKIVDEFYMDKKTNDGYSSKCKDCQKIYQKELRSSKTS